MKRDHWDTLVEILDDLSGSSTTDDIRLLAIKDLNTLIKLDAQNCKTLDPDRGYFKDVEMARLLKESEGSQRDELVAFCLLCIKLKPGLTIRDIVADDL